MAYYLSLHLGCEQEFCEMKADLHVEIDDAGLLSEQDLDDAASSAGWYWDDDGIITCPSPEHKLNAQDEEDSDA